MFSDVSGLDDKGKANRQRRELTWNSMRSRKSTLFQFLLQDSFDLFEIERTDLSSVRENASPLWLLNGCELKRKSNESTLRRTVTKTDKSQQGKSFSGWFQRSFSRIRIQLLRSFSSN